jgi:hypothetical protein
MFIFARRGIPLKEIFEAADKGQSYAYWVALFLAVFLLILIGSAVWRTLKALREPFRFISLIYALVDICMIGFLGTMLFKLVIRLLQAPG